EDQFGELVPPHCLIQRSRNAVESALHELVFSIDDVQLIAAEDQFVQRGLDRITAALDKAVGRDKLTVAERDDTLARITGSTDYAQLEDCQLVIEAVPETLAIKEPVLTAISENVSDDCVIASNT